MWCAQLERSLYGLKQAPRCWNQKFKEFLDQFEFKCSEADQCIFVGQFDSATVYLALFVDDGLIAAKSKKTIDFIIEKLSDKFEIKVCDSSVFVGLQIKRDRNKKNRSHTPKSVHRKSIRKIRDEQRENS